MPVSDPKDFGEAGSQPVTDSNTTQTRSGHIQSYLIDLTQADWTVWTDLEGEM